MSKALKQRAFTKLGLLIALCAGVAVSILLSTTDGTAIVSWPNWFATNHWLTTVVRVGLFLVAIAVFYSIHKQKKQSSEHKGIPAKQAQLHARVRQLLLWFVSIELLFGQALLPRFLEYLFS
ncbi:MAG: hypothetical protein F4227_00020 [Gammaproteobacteria bacterium]|nr:hypothetical protein [Gammaproteobacteria bacterium]MYF01404.1 hypothetical protein [Gammaproteobacteria bacterium]MYI76668.1 hypothetical protein [Gammaproteobacteria bacterium]